MSSYEVERSAVVGASPERVHALVADLRAWEQWSPWADLDPAMQQEYSGPPSGVGARHSWSGNRKAGQGRMEVTGDRPDQVDLDLQFDKPFRSRSAVSFLLRPVDDGTHVTWRMTGEQHGVAALVGKVLPMDKLLGKDFEKGLARLRAAAESPA
ncbi:SRPBCC family protein [Nocardioides marmoraquaticus]